MKLIELLEVLAKTLPNEQLIENQMIDQNEEIKRAIKTNDGNYIKNYLSDKQFYANENKVTVY